MDRSLITTRLTNWLLAGFARHLELCRQFYMQGNSGLWWDAELDLLLKGIEWCGRQIEKGTGFRYRLSGFELQAISDPV